MRPFNDLSNKTFAQLKTSNIFERRNGYVFWLCKCTCGNEKFMESSSLLNGGSISCGCARKKRIGDMSRTHGMSGTYIYKLWKQIKNRCYNEKTPCYKNYGGRGISVCERWLNSFEDFYTDIGERPSPAYSLDRADNNGDYTQENCRWATMGTQCNNRRSNIIITHDGKSLNIKQWSEYACVSYRTFRARLQDHGWGIERALNEPCNSK